MLMIESAASVSRDVPELDGSKREKEPGQALIKLDKGKGRAQDDVDDEDQVMALISLDDDDENNNSGSTNTVAMIRPAPSLNAPDVSEQQLVIPNALPTAALRPPSPKDTLTELPLPEDSHLARALNEAGLPETALMNKEGQLVPARMLASGSGDGLGRGELERRRREVIEKAVMAEEKDSRERTVPTWAYRVSRSQVFGPRAYRLIAPWRFWYRRETHSCSDPMPMSTR